MQLLLAEIAGRDVISAVIWVIVLGIIFGLLWWLIDYVNIPEPFSKVARVVLAVAGVVLLINVLLGLAGHPFIRW